MLSLILKFVVRSIMDCPKCKAEFETISFEHIKVERCANCQGLWFDMLKKEDLLKIKGSESIDIGSELESSQYRDMKDIDCPHCNERMMQMIDKDQFHIKYELCLGCYGTFFDAGEFRDLKENTVVERFTKMLKTLRTNF